MGRKRSRSKPKSKLRKYAPWILAGAAALGISAAAYYKMKKKSPEEVKREIDDSAILPEDVYSKPAEVKPLQEKMKELAKFAKEDFITTKDIDAYYKKRNGLLTYLNENKPEKDTKLEGIFKGIKKIDLQVVNKTKTFTEGNVAPYVYEPFQINGQDVGPVLHPGIYTNFYAFGRRRSRSKRRRSRSKRRRSRSKRRRSRSKRRRSRRSRSKRRRSRRRRHRRSRH